MENNGRVLEKKIVLILIMGMLGIVGCGKQQEAKSDVKAEKEEKAVSVDSVLEKKVTFPVDETGYPKEDILVVDGQEIPFKPGEENEIMLATDMVEDNCLEILLPEGETYRKWCILEDVEMCFRGYEVVKISVDIDEEQRLEGKATEIDRFLLELDMMQTPQLEFKCVELDECNKGFAEMKAQTKIIFKFKEDTAQ